MSQELKTGSTQQPLYSHHTFIFAFEWKAKNTNVGEGIDEVVKTFEGIEIKDDEGKAALIWEKDIFKINRVVDYNEFNYFYDYVREILFGLDGSSLARKDSAVSESIRHYQLKTLNLADGEETYFTIHRGKKPPLVLVIDSIILHLYETGVAMISFHLHNRSTNNATDILEINQYGRRLYPPFMNIPLDLVGSQAAFDYDNFSEGLNSSKGLEISHAIEIGNSKNTLYEDFSQYGDPTNFKDNSVFIAPKFLLGLLPTQFTSNYMIHPLLDDRMFVVCWYGNDEISNTLAANFEDDDWWYKFVFVDGDFKTIRNPDLQRKNVKQATFDRWKDFGTLFGVSDYSFVLVTASLPSLVNYGSSYLVTHLQTIYYKMAELQLVQRASIQRFADRVTVITRPKKDRDATTNQKISDLYFDYIRFLNIIFFREVTSQQQGKELYTLMHKQSGVEKQVTDLEREIQELHNYSMQYEQQRTSEETEKLAKLGGLFIPIGLVTTFLSFFAAERFFKSSAPKSLCWENFAIFLGVVFIALFVSKYLVRIFFLITGVNKKQ